MTLSELVRSLAEHCQEQVEGRHVLAVSDSSEINLQSHSGRLKPLELGVVGNNTDVGFYIHPTLVLDSESGRSVDERKRLLKLAEQCIIAEL